MTADDVKKALQIHASARDAAFLQRFFKTGPGQYGEGDVFIGVRVPPIRIICRQFQALALDEVQVLLDSEVHEHRMAALLILTLQYAKADQTTKQAIYDLYLQNVYAGRVNNWDLVDVTCHAVIGEHLIDRSREVLFELAGNDNLWQRRVAVISCFAFIARDDASTSLKLAEVLLHDTEDLIQKAVGWSLREVGKRVDRQLLLDFLDVHAHEMPRTMLRYSLEHLSPEQKQHYMTLKNRT